ncbi:hypothetical protein [Nisaea sp.]|uniref:hypothetical protein n=1 Tax=Nisaea sp. TaxID=2024842 RepID=UPI002B274965|nr:hypothetical protein [Nisaea sp.]
MRKQKLSDTQVDQAVQILDGWNEKLTWNAYLEVLAKVTGISITRQGIRQYPRITDSFDQTKTRVAVQRQAIGAKAGIVRHGDMALAYEVQKNKTLQAKVERLERENKDLLEQFLRWQYNAQANGLSPELLNRPLPARKTHLDRQTNKKREPRKQNDA